MDVVLAQVADLFGLRSGWIFLIHEQTGETYLAASHNLPLRLSDEPALMSGRCYCLDTYYAGDLDGAANVNIIHYMFQIEKTCTGQRGTALSCQYSTLYVLHHQTRWSAMRDRISSAQTTDTKQKLGVLNVVSTDWRELSEGDLQLLYTVGYLLSIAIERAQLFD